MREEREEFTFSFSLFQVLEVHLWEAETAAQRAAGPS